DGDAAELIAWFTQALEAARLPREPFDLTRWARIGEPAKWYATLEADIAAGPRGARGRNGVVLEDLEALRRHVGRQYGAASATEASGDAPIGLHYGERRPRKESEWITKNSTL
ncbi:MAG: hypothetical protein ACREQY_06445, partial [Candidatus Binatia bacterium]